MLRVVASSASLPCIGSTLGYLAHVNVLELPRSFASRRRGKGEQHTTAGLRAGSRVELSDDRNSLAPAAAEPATQSTETSITATCKPIAPANAALKHSKMVAAATAAAAAPTRSMLSDALEEEHKRLSALNHAMQKLNKKLGSGTIMRMGEASHADRLECISSGCFTLDVALGGGWPRGRIVEIFGPESSGKSTLALQAIAEVQKAGGKALLVDAEHALNRDFAEKLGVQVQDLLLNQPSHGEEAFEVIDTVLRSGGVDLIAVDSVAALLPRSEQEGDIGQIQVAGQARLMSAALRKITGTAAKMNCTVIFINQIRHKVGVLFGSPETTSGGNALKFYASQRVDVRVKEKVKGAPGAGEVGVRVKAKVVKNKVAAPYRSAEFIIAFNKGIDKNANLLEACELLGIVNAKGSHYYYKQQHLGQGRDAVSSLLAGSGLLRGELIAAVNNALQDSAALEAALCSRVTLNMDGDDPAAAGPHLQLA